MAGLLKLTATPTIPLIPAKAGTQIENAEGAIRRGGGGAQQSVFVIWAAALAAPRRPSGRRGERS